MPRRSKRLSAAFVKTVTEPGKYYDQHGLILRVLPSGGKQWIQRLVIGGKRRDLGLRTYPLVSLAEAREQAFTNRKLARAGGDPLALMRRPDVPTFEKAAAMVIGIHRPSWKPGGKSAAQWEASLRDYVFPRIGDKRVDQVTTADVMAVLLALWNDKPETARRVRQRIGAVMKWAVAQGYRPDNPAGEAIGAALPKHNHIIKRHHRALPHAEVAGAIEVVRGSGAYAGSKLAFEFLILTACRSGEVRLATWDEIDLGSAEWTIPPERMKAKRDHRVPLSNRAVEVLREAQRLSDGMGLVFPSPTGRTISDNTLSKLLRELGINAVPHGFRSSFRDWAAECTNAPRAVMEAALAHVVGGVEGAYARSDLIERRRRLMDDWAVYLNQKGGKVVAMVRRG